MLSDIPAHSAAFAARGRGGSPRAASAHLDQRYLLHLDLSAFFPSVSRARVLERLRQVELRDKTARLLTDLVIVENELPQGAPSSPAVADLVLYPMDRRISRLADGHGWKYTRYVDDLGVSGPKSVEQFGSRLICKIVSEEGWAINKKGGLFGPHDRKQILGLTVNSRLGVPAAYRSQIRKTLLLAGSGCLELDAATRKSLHGKIAWIFSVNPLQGRRLRLLLSQVIES